jgi:hypothetical protein
VNARLPRQVDVSRADQLADAPLGAVPVVAVVSAAADVEPGADFTNPFGS